MFCPAQYDYDLHNWLVITKKNIKPSSLHQRQHVNSTDSLPQDTCTKSTVHIKYSGSGTAFSKVGMIKMCPYSFVYTYD